MPPRGVVRFSLTVVGVICEAVHRRETGRIGPAVRRADHTSHADMITCAPTAFEPQTRLPAVLSAKSARKRSAAVRMPERSPIVSVHVKWPIWRGDH